MTKRIACAVAAAVTAAVSMAGAVPAPAELAAKMAEQLFRTKPEVYKPVGCDTERPWYGGGKMMYCVVATWVNALECARITGNKALEKRLLDLYPRIADPATQAIPKPDSVDDSLFGALPLEVAILTKDKAALELGLRFANAQWEQPLSEVRRNWAMPGGEEQKKLVADGYSTQTRIWIDDMYMITALQVQAARAAGRGRMKYLDRAAHQMHLYIDRLQRDDGLFNHSADVPIAWGRGIGWMAGGMALLLNELPENHPERDYILASYRRLAAALERWQRPNGLWGQIVDDPESWDESSGSAMFAYLFAKGVNRYWIEWGYLAKAQKAYAALAAKVDQYGNVADVCEGTNAKNDREHYMKRPRVNGAPYGQAAMQLLCTALYEESLAKPRKKKHQTATPMERAASGVAAKIGEFRLEPTYDNVSVSWGAPKEFKGGVEMSYRKVGERAWREAVAPLFFAPNNNYRGSVMRLEEDTEYEVRIVPAKGEAVSGRVRTWKTDVPVAETVEIDPASVTFPIRIDRKGRPDGWIRYVPKGRKTLVNDTYESTFVISAAQYVILDGFTIVGGKCDGSIRVDGCSQGVRILNCELSGWGPGGPPKWGKQRGLCFEGDKCVQNGAIVLAYEPHEVTIERCFIHSPRGRAHSWRYSHPYGPAAVQVWKPYSTVIRWCDFVGSDSRRFEDCIKSTRNDGFNTGLNRNSDVQGCFLFGANDDCIELDGGQQNVRFYDNRCEEGLMGVSVQFNQMSPSYVYDNAFTGLGSEFGHKVSSVKTASIDSFHYGSASYVLRNVFCGPGSGAGAVDMSSNRFTARLNVFDNVFVGPGQGLVGTNDLVLGKYGRNVFVDRDPDAVTRAELMPARPLPWTLDAGRIDVTVEKGALSRSEATLRLSCGGEGYRRPFKVRTTDLDHEWFDVSPKEGMIESGREIVFTVRFDAAKLAFRRHYAAAFVVRADDGFSRPVSVHAETDFVAPFKVENPRDIVVYGTREEKTGGGGEMWTFEVPEAHTYYLFVRGYNPKSDGNAFSPAENSLTLTVDGAKRPTAFPQLNAWPTWVPVNPGTYNITGIELAAGKHAIAIDGKSADMTVEGFALAREPLDMEGQRRDDKIR